MKKIKYRNMPTQVLLMVITLGFYSVYWFYETACELQLKTGDTQARPGVWTLLLFVPVGNLYSWYLYCELYSRVGTERLNKWILWTLSWLFIPALWFLVQRDLNMWARSAPDAEFRN